jgi:type VI secretion system protein ImpG
VSEDLLTYYNRELSWFRRALAKFGEAHPKTAGNLRISEDAVEDPHISRLIESVAFLNARIQSRLDDDFPRVVAALLEHLYPFYLAPKPSMLLAQVQAAPGLDSAVNIEPGYLFETEPVNGVPCRFRTTYPVTVTPLAINSAQLLPKPFNTPGAEGARGANAVLELKFTSAAREFSLPEEDIDSLTIHIKPDQQAWSLYDLLYKDCVNIVIASSDLDPSPARLDPMHIQPIGLAPDERILPNIGDTESQYQLLGEYFYYSEKYLFFQITGLKQALADRVGDFQVYIYLADSNRELENSLTAHSFGLHCTPMINIFDIAAEPCKIKHEIAEYPIIPEASAIGDMEVYAITGVTLIDEGSGEQHHVPPYYGFSHDSHRSPVYWHSSRRPALAEVGRKGAITDSFLSLTNLQGDAPEEQRQTMQVQCLCSNGNLPSKLPYGGGQPKFFPVEPLNGVKEATSISPPSSVRRLDLGHGLLWRLLSHLNLNYLSLVGGKDPAEQLREMLRLYDHGEAPAIRSQINAVDSLKTRIISLPMSVDGRPVICRGVDVEIMFDPSILDSGSALLFGNVLMQFLSMYVNLNSFVRLTVRIKGRDSIYHSWEPVVGNRAII